MKKERICILGAGSWGIALGILLNNNGHQVTLWSAVERELEMITSERENKLSLKGIRIPDEITVISELGKAVKDQEVIVLAVSSNYIRQTAHRLQNLIPDSQIIINVAKGIEESTLMMMSEIIQDELPNADVAVLSGPSHAEEVGRSLPTTCVVGAKTKETAEYIQKVFMSNVFRVYTSPDILGIEIGGALKNVIALAAGIADGLGYGDNTKAALITRGIREITRLGVAMGAKPQTFSGLSGMGDLIVTCASKHSRNRRAGMLIGQGLSMDEAMKEVQMVVEGVYAAKAGKALGIKYNASMPIIEKICEVLFENIDVREAVNDLMLRDQRREYSEIRWDS